MGPEAKLYKKLTKEWNDFSFTRLENISILGTPDLLVYNTNRHFFTIELKVTKGNKIKFSPHQIAFHVKHPNNTFILVQDACSMLPKLYEGKNIRELAAWGLKLDACCSSYESCSKVFDLLGA